MKKTIIISIATLIVVFIVGVWMYLMLYGKPAGKEEVFARFGFGETEVPSETITVPYIPPEVIVDNSVPTRLQQITTRPVAGAGFTETGIRYVEQGTGHVYEINLDTRVETLVSGTTIPRTTDALFSNNMQYIAITSFSGNTTVTAVGTVRDGELHGVELPRNAIELSFTEAGTGIHYALKQTTELTGFLYDLTTEKSTEVFTVQLRDVHVLWGNPLYVYTTPTAVQTGYVYSVGNNNELGYLTEGMGGLVATRYGNGIVISSVTDETQTNIAFDKEGTATRQLQSFIPEKCTPDPLTMDALFCAVPKNVDAGDFPDSWYTGTVSYQDELRRVDMSRSETRLLLDPAIERGRDMDVKKIGTDALGVKLYIIEKNDNTLWIFDRASR